MCVNVSLVWLFMLLYCLFVFFFLRMVQVCLVMWCGVVLGVWINVIVMVVLFWLSLFGCLLNIMCDSVCMFISLFWKVIRLRQVFRIWFLCQLCFSDCVIYVCDIFCVSECVLDLWCRLLQIKFVSCIVMVEVLCVFVFYRLFQVEVVIVFQLMLLCWQKCWFLEVIRVCCSVGDMFFSLIQDNLCLFMFMCMCCNSLLLWFSRLVFEGRKLCCILLNDGMVLVVVGISRVSISVLIEISVLGWRVFVVKCIIVLFL